MALPGKPFVKFAGILKQIAPTLLAGLGGPAGALVGAIVKKSLGDPTMTDTAMQDAVAAATTTPEGLEKLKQIEADLQKAELDYQIKFEELEVEDRDSARNRQVTLRDTMPQQVFYLTGSGFVLAFFAILFHGLPAEGSAIVLTMVGTLGTVFVSATAYFVGTTRSSGKKDDTIADMAKGT
jgi:hypothetical protein